MRTQASRIQAKESLGSGSNDNHWRESVFGAELMSPRGNRGRKPLSEITIWSLADIGYSVDATRADLYRLPTVVAKPVVAAAAPWCRVMDMPPGAVHEAW